MRTFFLLTTLLITFVACNNNDDEPNNELTITELLENGSPWVFNRFEVSEILNPNTSFSNEQIESIENQARQGLTLSFSQDGSGYLSFQETNTSFTWTLNNDILKITYPDNSDIETYEDFSVNENEFRVNAQSNTYDESLNIDISYNGSWIYE